MIQIYSPTNTEYDYNGDAVLLPEEATVSVILGSTWQAEIAHPIDKEGRWKYIVTDAVLSLPSFNGTQLFRIIKSEVADSGVYAKAQPIFYDCADEVFLTDLRPTDKSGQEALDILMEGTKYSGESDIETPHTAYYIYKNLLEALNGDIDQSFVSRWGGEIIYDNFSVEINEQAGFDNGVEIRYGKNIPENGFTVTEDMSDVITRIYPKAFNGRTLTDDGYVDSEHIDDYPTVRAATVTFEKIKLYDDCETEEDEDGNVTISEDDDITICYSQDELDVALIAACEEEYDAGCDLPSVTIECDMVLLQNTEQYKDVAVLETVSLGDTVHVINTHIGFETEARVIELEYDSIAQKVTSVKLGDFEYDYFSSSSKTVSDVAEELEELSGDVSELNALIAEEIYAVYASFDTLVADSATFTELEARVAAIETAYVDTAYISELIAGYATVSSLEAVQATIESLDTTYAEIDFANVETATIVNGFVSNLLTAQGFISETAEIGELAVTGYLTGVQIVADVITAGTLSVERLIITGEDSIVYEINASSSGLTATQLDDETYQNYINGTVIAAQSITATQIAAGTITANEIASGTITAAQIASGTITANEIAASTITANEIAANTITANEIASGTITATELAAGSVTADKISVSDLSALGATIGGFYIGDDSIYSLYDSYLIDENIYIGRSGLSLGSSFSVTMYGVLYAAAGTIGALTLSDEGIYSDVEDADSSYVGWSRPQELTSDDYAFFAGAADQYGMDGKYYVTYGGFLYAGDAQISGTLTAESGSYKAVLDSGKLAFYYDDTKLGQYVSSYLSSDDSVRSISLQLEYGTGYMGFSRALSEDTSSYTLFMYYDFTGDVSGYSDSLIISGKIRILSTAYINGYTQINGSTDIYGDTEIYGDLIISSDAEISGDAEVSGSMDITGALYVTGNAYLYGMLYVATGLGITFRNSSNTMIGYVYNDGDEVTLKGESLSLKATDTALLYTNGDAYAYGSTSSNLGSEISATYIRGSEIYIDGASYSSDARVKEDIEEIGELYIDLLGRLTPRSFRYIWNDDTKYLGFIAQEVIEAARGLGFEPDALIRWNSRRGIYSLDYNGLITALAAGYKKLLKRVEVLEHADQYHKEADYHQEKRDVGGKSA